MSDLNLSSQRLAEGDFSALVSDLTNAGLRASSLGIGMLEVSPMQADEDARILISAGIHGDETAPVEILAEILSSLLDDPHGLRASLFIVIGNPDAIALQKRYVD